MNLKNYLFERLKPRGVFYKPSSAIADEVVNRIEVEQFTAWVRHSYVMYPVGLFSMSMLMAFYRNKWGDKWIDLSALSLLMTYLIMILVGQKWIRSQKDKSKASLARIRLQMGFVRFTIGTSWAGLIISMMNVADPNQRALLYGAGVALMSTGIFGGSIIYGLTVWIPVTLGFWTALVINFSVIGIAPLLSFIGYAILTIYSIFYLSGKIKDLAINTLQLKNSNEIIGIVLHEFEENSSDWLWETDAAFNLQNISPRFAEILGQRSGNIAISLRSLLLADIDAAASESDLETFNQRLRDRQSFRKLTLFVIIDEIHHWWNLSGKPTFSEAGEFLGYRGVGSDVTEAHGFRQRIDYLARYDALTNLYNRSQFKEALEGMFEAPPGVVEPFCLISLDLDNFKGVNDTYGHAIGDDLLSAVARRILGCIRDDDTAARLGGDEFCVLLPAKTQHEAKLVAARIVETLAKPFLIGDFQINTGASAGVACTPDDADSPKRLLKHADIALYQAKAEGRGTYCQYSDMLERKLEERRAIEADLRLAIDREEFVLFFQPIFSLATGHLDGVEALLRWQHPTKGLLAPAAFIEIAESTALIEPMGLWIIAEACRIGASLPRCLKIAINLSPVQLRDIKLPERIAAILAETDVRPEQIEFEITESAILETSGTSSTTLRELKALGVRFALDDFGTGHSSLSLLRRFHFDRVKIDKSFTSGLNIDNTDTVLIDQIVELSRKLKIDVTVEGVETAAQADCLRMYTGINVQGHLYAHADMPQALEKYMQIEQVND